MDILDAPKGRNGASGSDTKRSVRLEQNSRAGTENVPSFQRRDSTVPYVLHRVSSRAFRLPQITHPRSVTRTQPKRSRCDPAALTPLKPRGAPRRSSRSAAHLKAGPSPGARPLGAAAPPPLLLKSFCSRVGAMLPPRPACGPSPCGSVRGGRPRLHSRRAAQHREEEARGAGGRPSPNSARCPPAGTRTRRRRAPRTALIGWAPRQTPPPALGASLKGTRASLRVRARECIHTFAYNPNAILMVLYLRLLDVAGFIELQNIPSWRGS